MGLDTLDENRPRDSDQISLGDDAIRETRAAIKQTFGVEHYLDGSHKIPGGNTAARPAAGNAGRLFYNTDAAQLEYDTGTAWAAIRALVSGEPILFTAFVQPGTPKLLMSRDYPSPVNVLLVANVAPVREVTPHDEKAYVRLFDPTNLATEFTSAAPWPWAVPVSWSAIGIQHFEMWLDIATEVTTPDITAHVQGALYVL